MKKSLIALAALATVATAAQAQSSVTVYGLFDAGVRVDNNAAGTGLSKTSFGNGVLNTSRLGFKGSEDLGGGQKANFNLEMGFNVTTGGLSQGGALASSPTGLNGQVLFDRFAWVGLSDSKLGEVRFGRDWNAGVHNAGLINAHGLEFEGNGTTLGLGGALRVNQVLSVVGNTSQLGTTRSDSMVKYLNTVGGVNFIATYGIGGQAGDADKRKSTSIGANTTISNVTLAASHFDAQDDSARHLKYTSIGGNIAFGPAKLFAGYNKIEQDASYARYNLTTATSYGTGVAGFGAAKAAEGKVTNVGVQYAWNSVNTSALSYFDGKYSNVTDNTSGKYKSYTFTHKYALSKRTTSYVSYDFGKIDGAVLTAAGATDNKNTGYGIGVIHAF